MSKTSKIASDLTMLETPVSIQALIEAALGLNNTRMGDRLGTCAAGMGTHTGAIHVEANEQC